MNNKKMIVSRIIDSISSVTEMNFQVRFTTMLKVICNEEYNLKFENVQPSNGDGKNDGWIPEKAIFFAMYSPNDNNISQINQINSKLQSDLDGLCNNVYNKGQWNKKISAFYLIVNTHDKDKPADKNLILDNTINQIKDKYNQDFIADIIIAKDIKSFLLKLDLSTLEKIADNLDIYTYTTNFNVPDVFDFVDEYVNYLIKQQVNLNREDYSRISIEKKIDINNLSEKKEYIFNLLNSSDKIDEYLKFINIEGYDISKYIKIKNYIIDKYNKLKDKYEGIALYDNILEQLYYEEMPTNYASILEAIVVNIFIKCDIFKKG